jgi:hypothetical protein
LTEWTTPDSRNKPSTANLEEEEIVDAPGNDGNASMPEQFKRHNPWKKKMMIKKICMIPRGIDLCEATNKIVSSVCLVYERNLKISEKIFTKFGYKDISSKCLCS